jgi:hypothetical protein
MGRARSGGSEWAEIGEYEENKAQLCVTLGRSGQNGEATVFKEKSKSFSKS